MACRFSQQLLTIKQQLVNKNFIQLTNFSLVLSRIVFFMITDGSFLL